MRSTANEPIEDATVFVDQTTVRTASEADGTFRLSDVGLGMQRVVFYHPDFEFGVALVDPVVQGSDTLRVILSPRANAAPQASAASVPVPGPVEAMEADEASLAGPSSTPPSRAPAIDQFARLYLGTHEECTLDNPDVLDAEMDRDGTVRVESAQPVSLSNDRLGYDVEIIMDRVVLNKTPNGFNRQAEAHLKFTPQVDAAAITAQTRAARERAYIGSFPHFLAALVEGRVYQEGLDHEIPVGGAEQSRGLAGAAGGGGLNESWAELRNPQRVFSYLPDSAVVVFESEGVRRIVHRSRAGLQREYARDFVGSADALGRPVSFYEIQTTPTRLTLAGRVVMGRPIERQGAWANTPVCYQLPLDYRPNR
ncbi:MAG: hypothetical protein GVY12_06545 [Bacteroidetes bacterium]|nr:hypothetical protein [Bacteroidota bacterium]